MKEEFWTIVCDRTPHLQIILIILFALLLGAVFSVLYTTAGTASHVIALVDLILILIAIAVALFLQWRCAKNEQWRGEWRPEKRREQ